MKKEVYLVFGSFLIMFVFLTSISFAQEKYDLEVISEYIIKHDLTHTQTYTTTTYIEGNSYGDFSFDIKPDKIEAYEFGTDKPLEIELTQAKPEEYIYRVSFSKPVPKNGYYTLTLKATFSSLLGEKVGDNYIREGLTKPAYYYSDNIKKYSITHRVMKIKFPSSARILESTGFTKVGEYYQYDTVLGPNNLEYNYKLVYTILQTTPAPTTTRPPTTTPAITTPTPTTTAPPKLESEKQLEAELEKQRQEIERLKAEQQKSKGICGPTAVVLLAMVPLIMRGLLKRRSK